VEVKERWLTRAAPTPLDLDALLAQEEAAPDMAGGLRYQTVPSVAESARGLLRTLQSIITDRATDIG
jgi:hypothetical protein